MAWVQQRSFKFKFSVDWIPSYIYLFTFRWDKIINAWMHEWAKLSYLISYLWLWICFCDDLLVCNIPNASDGHHFKSIGSNISPRDYHLATCAVLVGGAYIHIIFLVQHSKYPPLNNQNILTLLLMRQSVSYNLLELWKIIKRWRTSIKSWKK